jgi:tryptophan-rich sensory protein
MKKSAAAIVASGAVASALMAGSRYSPSQPGTAHWYASLQKPPFTPPGPAIGWAWTVLGGLLSYSGYRLFTTSRTPRRDAALAFWWANVVGVATYPWVFFGRKNLGASSLVVGGLLASAAATVAASHRVDDRAAAAATPLVAWVAFASLLSEELWRRNTR